MNITYRRYKMLVDFERVHKFLTDTYNKETLNSYLLPQYFEYAHTHSCFNHKMTHHNAIWEDNGNLVGVVCYEMDMGYAHLHVMHGYEFLFSDMIAWAEKELSIVENEVRKISIWITDKESYKQNMLQNSGYTLSHSEPVKIFSFDKPFVERCLPQGFTIIDGVNIDYKKLHECFWRGFDHGDTPDSNIDSNIQMCNAPRFDMSLMTIVVAPNGEYACALGMWLDKQNKYAYLEPLATVPEYRRMGIATVCLTEAMKKTKALGADYCFGGVREFYTCIGFETICNRELWKKEW